MNVEELRAARSKGLRPEAVGADLREANLREADLYGSDLIGANLIGANLTRANLTRANLNHRSLLDAGIVDLGNTPSGPAVIFPTPQGWWMQIGCWSGTPEDLVALIAKDDGWPEAEGVEITRRRPYLELVLAHAHLVITEKQHLIDELQLKWGA